MNATFLKCQSIHCTTQIKLSQGYTTFYFRSSVVWIAPHWFSTFGKLMQALWFEALGVFIKSAYIHDEKTTRLERFTFREKRKKKNYIWLLFLLSMYIAIWVKIIQNISYKTNYCYNGTNFFLKIQKIELFKQNYKLDVSSTSIKLKTVMN